MLTDTGKLKKPRGVRMGDKNPNWKGGIKSKDPKAYMKKYLKEYWKKYRLEKKELIQKNRQLYNERLKNAEGSHTQEEWNDLLREKNFQCNMCGTTEQVSKDHIIPISKGGSDYINNIQPLCMSCNRHKHNKLEI